MLPAAQGALACAAALTAMLAAGVAATIRSGARARCACFGARAGRPLGRAHLARNAGLLAVLVTGLVAGPLAHGQPVPAAAALAAATGSLAALVIIRWEDLADLFVAVPGAAASRASHRDRPRPPRPRPRRPAPRHRTATPPRPHRAPPPPPGTPRDGSRLMWGYLLGAGLPLLALGGVLVVLRRQLTLVTVTGESIRPAYTPGDRVLVRRARVGQLRLGQVVVVEEPGRGGTWRTPPPRGRPATTAG